MTLSEIYIALSNGDFQTVTTEVKKLNKVYRDGVPEITDPEYDRLIETIRFVNPENEIFNSGVIESSDEVNPDRKERLQYPMFSLEKLTSIEEIRKWFTNKNIPVCASLVITAKYDGISILKDEQKTLAWSRGDGTFGETMHQHYEKLGDKAPKINLFTIGEMLIPKPIFASRTFYRENGEPFKNARNMIAGLKNSDTVSEDLKYAKHIRYGFANEDFTTDKSEQLKLISERLSTVPFKICSLQDLTEEFLNNLYTEWGKEYDIDGLVIDINHSGIRERLGRERNNNPAYARAYKHPDWAQNAITEIIDIEWNISKQGLLKPVGILNPVELDGVTVSRVTLNNAKFVKENALGVGSIVKITRSGLVIPKVIGIIKASGFVMPTVENSTVEWNENGVELVVSGTEEQNIKKIISFFEILNTENVSEGIVRQLYEAGYKTINAILYLTKNDFERLEKFGKRKAEIVYDSIKKSTTNVDLAKLMHASGFFNNLGSKKLELLKHFETKPTLNEIINIEGFSDISANAFLEGYDKFYEWFSELPITVSKNNSKNITGDDLVGMNVVFTGVRRQDLVDILESRGGKNQSSISKNTTHLICKDKSSTSSKMQKALDMGIEVLSVDEFEKLLK